MRFLSPPWWWGAFSHRSPSLSLGSTSWCRESHHYQHDHESEYLLASAVSVWDLSRLDRSCVCSNCNAALVSLGIDVMTQIVAAAVSLALVSSSCVGCVDRPSYTLPSVVVWATVSSTAWYHHCHLQLTCSPSPYSTWYSTSWKIQSLWSKKPSVQSKSLYFLLALVCSLHSSMDTSVALDSQVLRSKEVENGRGRERIFAWEHSWG